MVDPGGPRSEMRPALVGLQRFAATIVTAKHRLFLFVDREILPDDALIVFALSDSFFLGILTSRIQCRLGAKRRWESGGSRALQQIAFLRSLPVSRSRRPDRATIDATRSARRGCGYPDLSLTALHNV